MIYTYVLKCGQDVRYVGITSNPKSRMRTHRYGARKGKLYVHNWMRDVGVENVSMTVTLGFETVEEAKAAEIRQIAEFRCRGYRLTNLSDGGEGTFGYSPTPETLAKLSAVRTGRKHSIETRSKMSAAQVGNTKALGIKQSPEWVAKRLESRRKVS